MYMASAHGTIVQSILHYKNRSHCPLYAFRFFRHIKTPHLSDRILSDKWGAVHFEKRFGFSILTAVLPVDIPTGWEPRTNKSPTGAFVAPPAAGPYGLRLLIFPQPLGRALKNQNAAPTTPPCFCRRQRSSSLLFKSSYPLLLLKGKHHVKQKDSYQKLSFLWCSKAIQIRTISL